MAKFLTRTDEEANSNLVASSHAESEQSGKVQVVSNTIQVKNSQEEQRKVYNFNFAQGCSNVNLNFTWI